MDQDQNFKNLILDYPREAIAFFAAAEANAIDADVRLLPIREEQLKERLGERFRELDVPLLAEWPDGRRAAILFVLEEETEPKRFSIHRLAHYCLDLAELYKIERLVPVVIFLHPGHYAESLSLGSETHAYLQFDYLHRALFATPAREHLQSKNLVARLALPTMAYAPHEKLAVYAAATRGLLDLEPDPEKQLKYADFIDIYAALDDQELERYQQRYPEEAKHMSGFATRFIEQGKQQGLQQGLQQGEGLGYQKGEASLLLRQLRTKFGSTAAATYRERVQAADPEQLEQWSERIFSAGHIEDLFR